MDVNLPMRLRVCVCVCVCGDESVVYWFFSYTNEGSIVHTYLVKYENK